MVVKKLLFLDDIRDTTKEEWRDYLTFSPIEQPFEVIWVKDYWEFKKYIQKNGLPDALMFDYDLSDFQAFKSGYPELMADTPLPLTERSGLDCVHWLLFHCSMNNLEIPPFNLHSANSYGKELMQKAFDDYKLKKILSGGTLKVWDFRILPDQRG